MPQTLLAVSALFCFGLLAFGRQSHGHDLAQHTVAIEAELAAVDVARARMSQVEWTAFDEADINRTGIRIEPSDSPLGPDAGETGPATFDDVDDWDGHAATEAVEVGMGQLRFQTVVRVRYVENLAPATPAPGPTLTKEIVVSTTEVSDRPAGRVPATATLRRVVTPASIDTFTPDA